MIIIVKLHNVQEMANVMEIFVNVVKVFILKIVRLQIKLYTTNITN